MMTSNTSNLAFFLLLTGSPDTRRTFTLQDYLSGDFQYKSFNLQWISGNGHAFLVCIRATNDTKKKSCLQNMCKHRERVLGHLFNF